MSTTLEGTDSAWVDGDLTDDWADEDDPTEVYIQRIARLLTCNGLWYAPTRSLDVQRFLLDVADDTQIQIEIGQVVEGDEETARCSVSVTRTGARGERVAVGIDAWTKRGKRARLTLAIDDVTGDLLVNGSPQA